MIYDRQFHSNKYLFPQFIEMSTDKLKNHMTIGHLKNCYLNQCHHVLPLPLKLLLQCGYAVVIVCQKILSFPLD